MDCPTCQYPDTRVIDSRHKDDSIKRYRQCMRCNLRFSTSEKINVPKKKKGEPHVLIS